MRIKSFIASTVQEALANVKREMGDSSIILETRNIEEGDIKSKSGQTLVEVVAAKQVFGQDKEDNQDEDKGQDTDQRQNSGQNTGNNVDENTGQKEQGNNGNLNLHSPVQHSPELCQPVQDQMGPSGNHAGKVMLADYFQPEDLAGIADLSPPVSEPTGDGEDEKSEPHTDQDVQSGNGDLKTHLTKQYRTDSSQSDQHPQEQCHPSDKSIQSRSGRQVVSVPDNIVCEGTLGGIIGAVSSCETISAGTRENGCISQLKDKRTDDREEETPEPFVSRQNYNLNDCWPEESKELYNRLCGQQVEREHTHKLINEVLHKLSRDKCGRMDSHLQMIREGIINNIKVPDSNSNDYEKCKTMAFIGNAGSGKTTTISKLVSEIKKRSDKDILLISIRGNSARKLNITASMTGATVCTATTHRELREIRGKFEGASHIFIDTPGISHLDNNSFSGLREYLDEIPNLEAHLVVSATTRYSDIINIVNRFTVFPIHRLLFTKADETNLYGTLFSVAMETQIPLSYITDGQEIPEDIRPVTAEMIAEMVMRS